MIDHPDTISIILQLHVPIVQKADHLCGYLFSGPPKWGEINMATSPLPSRGPHSGDRSI